MSLEVKGLLFVLAVGAAATVAAFVLVRLADRFETLDELFDAFGAYRSDR